jgi:hypothetical protein
MNGTRWRLLLALAVTLALGVTLVLAAGVLAALPALLAFIPLLAGRYLGADKLERLIAARARPSARRPRARARRPGLAPLALAPRGGRLIAFSLAKRPPPVPLALS